MIILLNLITFSFGNVSNIVRRKFILVTLRRYRVKGTGTTVLLDIDISVLDKNFLAVHRGKPDNFIPLNKLV